MEIWKEVKDYEGLYEVSNLGNIKSLPKKRFVLNTENYLHKGIMMKIIVDKNGYCYVGLYKDKKCKKTSIHYIVASSFLGFEKDKNLAIDHINNIKTDNRLSNLQIITVRLNSSKDRTNNSGCTGVCYNKDRKAFRSSIRINDKLISLCSSKETEKPKAYYDIAVENLNLYNGCSKSFREQIKNIYDGRK